MEPCLVTGLPHHRTIAALDIEQSTTRTDPVKAPLALVVSGDIYRSVGHHGYNGIDRNTFREAVRIHIAGYRYPGWIHIPAEGASYRITEMANYRQIARYSSSKQRRP